MMRARGRHSGADADNPFWITYSDLLSSLVMVFLVLLLAFMGLSTIENKKLREQTHVLEIQKEQLEGQQKTLDQMQKQLTKLEINDKLEHLGELRSDLLTLQRLFLENVAIDGSRLKVEVNDKILFEHNRSELLPDGKVFLGKFIPQFASIITQERYHGLIQGVLFEGHADPSGASQWDENYLSNLQMTLLRSDSVVRFVLGPDFGRYSQGGPWNPMVKERLRTLVTAAGRSNIESVRRLIPNSDVQGPAWTKNRAWESQDQKSRSVALRLTLYNPLPELQLAR